MCVTRLGVRHPLQSYSGPSTVADMTARARLAAGAEAGLVAAWQALAECAHEPNPFFEPNAVLPALRLRPDGETVRLLVVEDDGTLLLALPVVRGRYRRTVHSLLAWHHPYCYAGAVLLRPGRAEEAWHAVLDLLCAGRDLLLVLPRTPIDGPGAQALRRVLRARGSQPALIGGWERPVVHRRPVDDFMDYLAGGLGPRSRKSLRRYRRRLGEALGGDVALRDLACDAPADGLEQLLQFELSGWKGRAGTAVASSPVDAEMFRAWCRGFGADGRVQLWAFGANERPAAAQFNLIAGDTVFHVRTSYDEDFAPWSPGLQMEVALVEEFHRDRRLLHLDSCTDPGPSPSVRLYPDRQRLATLLVPLGRWGRLAAASVPVGLSAVDASRTLIRHLAGSSEPE